LPWRYVNKPGCGAPVPFGVEEGGVVELLLLLAGAAAAAGSSGLVLGSGLAPTAGAARVGVNQQVDDPLVLDEVVQEGSTQVKGQSPRVQVG
jgi:hypothetical protein